MAMHEIASKHQQIANVNVSSMPMRVPSGIRCCPESKVSPSLWRAQCPSSSFPCAII